MGWALLKVFEQAPAYTLALSAGFLLMGPFLCLGLYHVSKQLEAGKTPDFGQSLMAWDARTGTLAIFGFVLLVLEMLWGRASLIVFAGQLRRHARLQRLAAGPARPGEPQLHRRLHHRRRLVRPGLIYAVSVVSIPMILDRQTDAISAGLTSFRLVLTQPGVMLLWGALLTGLVVLALLPWFAGLLIIGPVTGHATWHAYRAAVVRPTEAAG